MQQAAANGSKSRHKAKVASRWGLREMRPNRATLSNPPQRVANRFFFRLLTGELLVRVQPEEPILSRICGRWIFRPIFTLPFSKPISRGFFFGAQEQPDARIGGFVEARVLFIPVVQRIDWMNR